MARKIQILDTFSLQATMMELEESGTHPSVVATYNTLLATGWTIHITDTRRGRCAYATRSITVPKWAMERSEDYTLWYLSHEMAHAVAGSHAGHGPDFMAALKAICPAHCIHYELGYKPRNAVAAGITMPPGEDF